MYVDSLFISIPPEFVSLFSVLLGFHPCGFLPFALQFLVCLCVCLSLCLFLCLLLCLFLRLFLCLFVCFVCLFLCLFSVCFRFVFMGLDLEREGTRDDSTVLLVIGLFCFNLL